MSRYGCSQRIRALAPTGTAASLIKGMTIHKGLGIKINGSACSKSSRALNVSVTINKKSELREEWKDVDVVLVDEIFYGGIGSSGRN